MKRRMAFLIFTMLLSCKSQKTIDISPISIETGNLKGKVKKIITNIYYPVQTGPSGLIKKEDVKNVSEKTYKERDILLQNYDSILFFKEPKFEVEYDKKGRTINTKNFIVKDTIVIIKHYDYEKDKTIITNYINKLKVSVFISTRYENGENNAKNGKVYTIKDRVYQIGKTIFAYHNGKVKTILNLYKNKDTISNTLYEYSKDVKILSIKTSSRKKVLIKQIDYKYLIDNEKRQHFTVSTQDDNESITKTEIMFDRFDLIQKRNVYMFNKEKRIDSKITQEYIYKNYSKIGKKLYQVKQTDSLATLFINETLTTYYKDKLIKEIKTNHASRGNTHFNFEYDFDEYGNWISKYSFDINKRGITQVELRRIEYY